MIVLLDTSTPVCRVGLSVNSTISWHEWEANRDLAKGLLRYLGDVLGEQHATLSDIQAIGVLKGPGSFTGLRIGLTVMNTLADSMNVPIVGCKGKTWAQDALTRLEQGDNDGIVMPDYGAAAHITTPRK